MLRSEMTSFDRIQRFLSEHFQVQMGNLIICMLVGVFYGTRGGRVHVSYVFNARWADGGDGFLWWMLLKGHERYQRSGLAT